MQDLTNANDLDAALRAPAAVLLKHGATCPISAAARDALKDFAGDHPDVPVYGVEVTGRRALSDLVADRFGQPHESPQVFVLRDGRPVWHAAHFDITPDAVAARLDDRRDD
ncbi:MAG: bacillithiol system redox-active protein YtxJ [Gemmatirosa sp.]